MTLNQLIDLFKDMGDKHRFINYTEFGEVQDKTEANKEDVIYPAFYQVPQQDEMLDNTNQRTFSFIVCDLVNPGHQNLNEVLSDCERTFADFMKVLRQQDDDFTLVGNPVVTYFKDGFGDDVAGVYGNVIIETDYNNGYCDLPFIDTFGYPGSGGSGGSPLLPGFDCDSLQGCPAFQGLYASVSNLDTRVTVLESATHSLTYSDIVSALNYIPYDSSNPAGYITQSSGVTGSYIPLSGTNGIDLITGSLDADQDLSMFYQPFSFIQKSFADVAYVPISISTLGGITSNVGNLGPRILNTVTDTVNSNSTTFDQRSNRITLSNNLASGFTNGMSMINGNLRLTAQDSNNNYSNDLILSPTDLSIFGSDNNSGSYFNIVGQNTGTILFEVTGTNDTITITINENDALVGAQDYTPLYSLFSYVQKIYVDNAIASIPVGSTPSLMEVLGVGNSTGTNSIIIQAGQQIVSDISTNNLDLNNNNDSILFSEGIVKLISDNANIELRGDYTDILKTANIRTESNRNAELNFITNNGIARHQMYLKDSDQTFNLYTVNSDTIFYNGIGSNQYETLRLTYDNNVVINQDNITFGSNYKLGKMFMGGNTRSYETLGIQNQNTAGYAGVIFGQDDNNIAIFVKGGVSAVGNFVGTSIPMVNTTIFQSGSGYDQPIHFAAGSITAQIGTTTNNYGYRLDVNGFRIGLNSTLDITNTNGFESSGSIKFDSLVGTGSRMVIADSNGTLSTQTIPVSNVYTAGNGLTLTGGTFSLGATALNNYLTIASASVTYQAVGSYLTASALLPYLSSIYKDFADSATVSATASEVVVKSVLIPANTFKTGDILYFKVIGAKGGGNGTFTIRVRINTINTSVGATNVAFYTTTGATSIYSALRRDCFIKGANTQTYEASSSISDELVSTTNRTNIPINWAVNQYLMVSLQNSSLIDISSVNAFIVERH